MLKITRATSADTETITRLNRFVQQLHVEAYPQIFKPTGDGTAIRQFFAEQLAQESNYFFLALWETAPIGYVWARVEEMPENPFKYQRRWMYIHQISVDADFRNMGTGSRLIQEVLELARVEKTETVALDSWIFNSDAHECFKKQGFDVFRIQMWQ